MAWRRKDGPDGDDAGGGLDDLFGADSFVEYDDSLNPFVAPPAPEPRRTFTEPVDIVRPTEQTPPLWNPAAPPLPEEPRGPIHDRFSATVAMPVVDPDDGDAEATAERAGADRPLTRREMREVQKAAEAGSEGAVAPDATSAPTVAYTAPLTGAPTAATTVLPHTVSTADATSGGGGVAASAAPARGLPALWARLTTVQRVLVCVAAGLLFAGLLVALFFVGRLIGGGAVEPVAEDPTAPIVSQLEPGVHPWTALLGGECLDPFTDPWADEFTVVDCGEPHSAQHLFRGEVGPDVTVYLDAEGWQGLTTTLCDASALLDLGAASAYTDLQWHITYAADATEWANGDRGYSCFVSRTSGEPIEGSLSAAGIEEPAE